MKTKFFLFFLATFSAFNADAARSEEINDRTYCNVAALIMDAPAPRPQAIANLSDYILEKLAFIDANRPDGSPSLLDGLDGRETSLFISQVIGRCREARTKMIFMAAAEVYRDRLAAITAIAKRK